MRITKKNKEVLVFNKFGKRTPGSFKQEHREERMIALNGKCYQIDKKLIK